MRGRYLPSFSFHETIFFDQLQILIHIRHITSPCQKIQAVACKLLSLFSCLPLLSISVLDLNHILHKHAK